MSTALAALIAIAATYFFCVCPALRGAARSPAPPNR